MIRAIPILLLAALPAALADPPVRIDSDVAESKPVEPLSPVWQAHLKSFDNADYGKAVEELISAFEKAEHRPLEPGKKKRVGLKIYTDSGPGLETPLPLVRAVIAALMRRGFANDHIFLVGLNQLRMRVTGYLPSLVTGKTPFAGNPVYVLESNRYYDPIWFYENALPDTFQQLIDQQIHGVSGYSTKDDDRKSFLATPLFLDADFWINLPVYTDHPVLGVNGALVNATLWNASNTARFFHSPANATAAVAEMAAIPELRQTWIFTIASLQIYQYEGGPFFNSLYTNSEPLVWLSGDPVLLDSLMRDRIDEHRRIDGFDPIPDDIRTLEFAEAAGCGSTRVKDAKIIPVN